MDSQVVGLLLMGGSACFFAYYTMWVAVTVSKCEIATAESDESTAGVFPREEVGDFDPMRSGGMRGVVCAYVYRGDAGEAEEGEEREIGLK